MGRDWKILRIAKVTAMMSMGSVFAVSCTAEDVLQIAEGLLVFLEQEEEEPSLGNLILSEFDHIF